MRGRAKGTWPGWSALLLAAGAALPSGGARGSALEYLPVGDPLEAEIRALDLLDPTLLSGRIALPHLNTRPLLRLELQGPGAGDADRSRLARPSLVRLERALARDASARFAPRPGLSSTPRLLALDDGAGSAIELSAGLEGRGEADERDSRLAGGSGLHARAGAVFDRWLAFAHVVTGRIEGARAFADPIVAGSDLIAHTEESYVAYAPPSGRWAMQLGRGRWHWGPGEEGALTLSRTSPALTGFAVRASLPAWRLDAAALSATLAGARGEQLAAHRLEWEARPGLRLGLTEMARYRASSWRPLYAVGVLPYILVQRLAVQDEPDSADAHRNNVIVAADAAWRVARGTRVYGEVMVDDLHARTSSNPDKVAFQLGVEGLGPIAGTRLVWGAEYTRLSRFVYSSYFGRGFEAQGRPLGFFTGPDARRMRVRGAWDLAPEWQIRAAAARTDRGENDLSEPYVPGSPRVATLDFEGVVERRREAELGVRWWPASGVDLGLTGGYRWIENARHVRGADEESAFGFLELRLTR